jgi:hypothetical protein
MRSEVKIPRKIDPGPVVGGPISWGAANRFPADFRGGTSTRYRMVDRHPLFRALMSHPVDFIMQRTLLARPESFERFLRDPGRVRAYLSHPLIRAVLDHPILLKRFLSEPAVVEGFLSSSAMRNPGTVAALASSGLMQDIFKGPGVRSALEDPSFLAKVLTSRPLLDWLSQNPPVLRACAELGPALAGALAVRGNTKD